MNACLSTKDLHPGNILVRGSLDKPSQLKLVILDSGMVATLSPNDFRNLHDTFEAVIKGNGREVGQLFLERSPMSHCKNPEKFISAMAEIVEIAQKDRITFDNTEVAKLLLKVFDTLQTNRVKLDANFAAVILSIMVIEGELTLYLIRNECRFLTNHLTFIWPWNVK